jgi:GNAT superfamily N-acetyltransferase
MGVDWERPVATTAVLQDPRQRSAFLSLFNCANDAPALEQLLERAAGEGEASSILGPVALSPYLGAGVLASHWSETPPLDTPYAEPYLAELLSDLMEPAAETRLYQLPASTQRTHEWRRPAMLRPLEPAHLAGELLPVLSSVYGGEGQFAAPDAAETRLLLDWWGALAPLSGWLAGIEGRPAGFVLLQPDISPWLQRARGGRRPWQRLWLRQAKLRASRGRVVLGGVLPDFRRRGIGRQLLAASVQSAEAAGWQTLLVGPLAEQSAAGALLLEAGAEPRQRYQLFRWQAVSEGWW